MSDQTTNLMIQAMDTALRPDAHNTVFFNSPGQEVMRITPDGQLVKGPGLSDDAASLLFFDACQKVFNNTADELRDLRAAVAEETRAGASLRDELAAERAAFAEFRAYAWEQQKDLRAERDSLLEENVKLNGFADMEMKARHRAEAAEAQLAAESAMLDWLESPYGRRFQKENQDALICRETIRVAMKESTQ